MLVHPLRTAKAQRHRHPRRPKMPDFKPKVAVQLDPPKNDLISLEELAKADGESLES